MKKLICSLALAAMAFLYVEPAHAVVNSSVYVRVLYSTANMSASAYSTLVSSTARALKGLSFYNSGVNPVVIAFGAAASEVDQMVIPPGVNSGNLVVSSVFFYPLPVSQGVRLSAKALNSTMSSGDLMLNAFYY